MSAIEVEIDLDKVFEQIETDTLVDELEARADRKDSCAIASLASHQELPFDDLTEFELRELKLAVEADDAKRALEILRRAM